MRHKLFKKQFGAIALIVFLSLSAILIILTFMYNEYIADQKYQTLQKSCESIADFIEIGNAQESEQYDDSSIFYMMNNLAIVVDSDIFITDQSGVIRICGCKSWNSDESCSHQGSQLNVAEIEKVINEGGYEINALGFYVDPHYTAVEIIETDGVKKGYIVAADSLDEAGELMKNITYIYVISAIIPLVLMFIALYFMTYRLTRPLRLMSEASKAMARGDFSRRIPVTRDDEIGQLAVSFNQMTNSLARLEEVRKSFIANVSHELRTPMTTIGGFIDGIMDGTIPPERQNHYLQIVHDEVKRLSRMVESMLSISRLESKETELVKTDFDFKEQLLGIVISQEKRIEEKNISINGLDELECITINADKDLIYRVVYNLVDNAIKFTEIDGEISFDIKLDSGKFTFRIENTGKGIPEIELPHVFERFYKVDKSRSSNKESTGLGLYIVKTIIKNHGGVIKVSSVENQFTAFEFTLPIR
ncbi:MAG: HAMP domain-containing histidine kinase [Clostridia bacterium]|nr:HAMP domain-containing histidine kinase [Clostridia bacterium]